MIKTPDLQGSVEIVPNNTVIFSGRMHARTTDSKLTYAAARPADRHASFSGSGLPFYNAEQAFDQTPNIGTVAVGPLGDFVVKCQMPNSYYIDLGTTLVQPTLYFSWSDAVASGEVKTRSVPLAQPIAHRKLTYPWQRTNASFYGSLLGLPVRSQEQVLRDSAYDPAHESSPDFWGLRPPV